MSRKDEIDVTWTIGEKATRSERPITKKQVVQPIAPMTVGEDAETIDLTKSSGVKKRETFEVERSLNQMLHEFRMLNPVPTTKASASKRRYRGGN